MDFDKIKNFDASKYSQPIIDRYNVLMEHACDMVIDNQFMISMPRCQGMVIKLLRDMEIFDSNKTTEEPIINLTMESIVEQEPTRNTFETEMDYNDNA